MANDNSGTPSYETYVSSTADDQYVISIDYAAEESESESYSGYVDIQMEGTKEYSQYMCLAMKLLTRRKLSNVDVAIWPSFKNAIRLALGAPGDMLCEFLQDGAGIIEDMHWKDRELLERFIITCEECIKAFETVAVSQQDGEFETVTGNSLHIDHNGNMWGSS